VETITEKSPLVLLELRANRTVGKGVIDFLIYAGVDAPRETIRSAIGDLCVILDDTAGLLKEAFDYKEQLGASRLPKRPEKPLTPAEALEALGLTLDFMKIEVEALLRKPWATDEEYRKIARRRDHVIRMMGFVSRYYKAVISHRDPVLWSPDVEKRFSKFINIKP
jgi:hypothetical protein